MNQADLNLLLDHSLSWGCDELEKNGFFHPYAITLQPDGELQRSGELTDEEKNKDPEELLEQIHAMLAAGCRQKLHKAVAVGVDVKVQRFKSEGFVKAIEVMIEHEDGNAFDCFLPYRKKENGSIEYGQVFSSALSPEKFTL